MGAIRQLVRSHVANKQGNLESGLFSAASQLQELLQTGKISPSEVSLQEVYEEFVDPGKVIDLHTPRSAVRVSEAVSTSYFPVIMNEVIEPVFLTELKVGIGEALRLVSEVDVNRETTKIAGVKRDLKLRRVKRGMNYEEGRLYEEDVEITQFKFGVILSLLREDIIFDRTGEILRQAADIGLEAGLHLHRYIIEKVTDVAVDATGQAIGTALKYKGTNYAIYANNHSAIDGQTNNNLTATPFGTAGVKGLVELLRRMKNFRGDPVVANVVDLLIPPELETDAAQLYLSEKAYDDNKNGVNPYKNRFAPITSEFLTSPTRYWMGNFARQNRLQWVWPPEVVEEGADSALAFSNDIVQRYRVGYFAGIGATDYRYTGQGGV